MKLFTIRQAKAMIPLLETELGALRPAYAELKHRWSLVSTKSGHQPADPEAREICLEDKRIRNLIAEVDNCFQRFENMGIECKGVEEGLFDFPCLLEDRIVYLCWQEGEEEIKSWHEIDSGYAMRKPLFEATRLQESEQKFVN